LTYNLNVNHNKFKRIYKRYWPFAILLFFSFVDCEIAVNDRVVSGSREQRACPPSLGVTIGSKTLAVKIHLQKLAILFSINLGGELELYITFYNKRTQIVLKTKISLVMISEFSQPLGATRSE